jgi:hypothetical protein
MKHVALSVASFPQGSLNSLAHEPHLHQPLPTVRAMHHTADPRSLNRIQKALLISLNVNVAELPSWHAYSIFMSTCSVPSSWPSSCFRPSNRRVRVSSQFLTPRPFLNIPTIPARVTKEGHWLTHSTSSASNGHSYPNGCFLRHRCFPCQCLHLPRKDDGTESQQHHQAHSRYKVPPCFRNALVIAHIMPQPGCRDESQLRRLQESDDLGAHRL